MESLIPNKKPRIRARVKEDITALATKYPGRIGEVNFLDETIPYYNQQWRDSWGDLEMPFYGSIRADIEPRLLSWLCDKGLTETLIGIESPDEEYRNKVFNKQVTDGDIYRTVRMLHHRGVDTTLTCIYGAPGQAEDTKEKALAMVKKITRHSLFEINEGAYTGDLTYVQFVEYGDYSELREQQA